MDYSGGPAPRPLRHEEFAALVRDTPGALDIGPRCLRRRFPVHTPTTAQLTDDERGRLWHEIEWTLRHPEADVWAE